MKDKILFTLIGVAIFGINILKAQTIFSTKEEVVDYLEGEWNLDVVQGGFAGVTYFLPSPNYFDSTVHKFVFESAAIDSTPLICRYFIDDTLNQETFVSVSQNLSQIILPRWILYNLPDNLMQSAGLMEEYGFYGFSQDTLVVGAYAITDGYYYGLTRLTTNTTNLDQSEQIRIYPNPSKGQFFIEGIGSNTSYQLFDITGKLVKQDLLNTNFLMLENKGIYILRLKIQDRWILRKIVVH